MSALKKALTGIGTYEPQSDFDASQWACLAAFLTEEPRAFARDPSHDHVTASAFVLSRDLDAVVLTHHVKLDKWLHLGGHCDGIMDAPFVALKEAYEESGLSRISPLSAQVFDVDIHRIPARKMDPEHQHFDVRYLCRADAGELTISAESHDLAWVPLDQLERYTQEVSMLRMRDKARDFIAQRRGD